MYMILNLQYIYELDVSRLLLWLVDTYEDEPLEIRF